MSLAATTLNDARIKYADANLDKFEHKRGNYGIVEAFKADTNRTLTPAQIEEARTAPQRTVNVPVMQRGSVTIKNVRSCTISGGKNTSALIPVTWKTYAFDVEQIPAEFDNNEIAKEQDLIRKVEDGMRDLMEAIEADAYAALENGKSQVNKGGGNYTMTGNALQIPKGDDHKFNELKAIMRGNKFKSINWTVVANPYFEADVEKLYAQGYSNDENTAYQFNNWNFGYSHAIVPDTATPGSEKQAEGFIIPEGSLAMLTWIDRTSQRGKKLGDKEWFTSAPMPILGESMGVFFKEDCVDKSTDLGAGNEQVPVEQYQFSIDVAFLTAYNSNPVAEPSPIFKFEVPQV